MLIKYDNDVLFLLINDYQLLLIKLHLKYIFRLRNLLMQK